MRPVQKMTSSRPPIAHMGVFHPGGGQSQKRQHPGDRRTRRNFSATPEFLSNQKNQTSQERLTQRHQLSTHLRTRTHAAASGWLPGLNCSSCPAVPNIARPACQLRRHKAACEPKAAELFRLSNSDTVFFHRTPVPVRPPGKPELEHHRQNFLCFFCTLPLDSMLAC